MQACFVGSEARRLTIMSDRREAGRLRKLKSGKISFGRVRLMCTVKSLAESGACLEFQTTRGLPGKFELAMVGEQPKSCSVTWADDRKVGVQFK
jgi:hypothetical protein